MRKQIFKKMRGIRASLLLSSNTLRKVSKKKQSKKASAKTVQFNQVLDLVRFD